MQNGVIAIIHPSSPIWKAVFGDVVIVDGRIGGQAKRMTIYKRVLIADDVVIVWVFLYHSLHPCLLFYSYNL